MIKTLKLDKRISIEVKPKPPFNFNGTCHPLFHFPVPDFEWQKGIYWQTMNFKGKFLGIKLENQGTLNKPKIKLTIYSKKKLTKQKIKDILNELNWRYGFNEDISEFYQKFKSDKFLGEALEKWKGMRLNCSNSLYELLIIAIVLQNATVRRTVQMMNILFEKFGTLLKFDNKKLYVFWNPKDLDKISEKNLRKLKIGYRAKMIKKISESFSQGKINEFNLREMKIENIKKELSKLYGVGPATIQIILGEYFRRYEIFDLKGRLWEQKLLSRILFNKKLVPQEKILNLLEKRYGKWKYLACYYLFQNLFWQHKKKKITWLEKEIRL
jgi:3-methyladenine DNA glycosylase/8-oxoguanine DNA glycosylase